MANKAHDNGSIPVLGLIRVSTKQQARQGYSPAEQRAAIARFAQDNRLRVVEFVQEEKTGFTLDRKDVRRLRELARQGAIRAIVAFVMDRLSRDLELQISLRKEIKRLGLELYTTTRGLIEDTPEANLLSNVEGAFSQHEIEVLVRRSKMGKIGKAKQGKWVGVGHPPYGAHKVGERGSAHLVLAKDEIAIVKQIFDWYTGWQADKPLGLIPICERLMEQRVQAPFGGWRWWPSTISKILKSRAYLGYVEYRGIEIKVPALAVIERSQWNAAQRQSQVNTVEADRNRKREYLMARRLTCACGRAMTAITRYKNDRGDTTSIYFCVTRGQPKGLFPVCHFGTITVKKVDTAVWAFIRQSLSDDRLLEGLRETDRVEQKAPHTIVEQIQEIDAEISGHEKQIEILLGRFGSETENDQELAAMVELKIRDTRQKIIGCRARREELLSDSDRRAEIIERRRDIYTRLHRLHKKLDRANFEMRRQAIDLLDVKVKLACHEDGRRFGYLTCLLFDEPQVIEFDPL